MITIHSLDEMNAFGARLAGELKEGDVVCLHGELGVGKSALARAVIRAWLGDEDADVPSPSFTLVQNYQAEQGEVNHFDLYRLTSEDELIELGLPEIFEHAISLIEWPERLGDLPLENAIHIELQDLGDDARALEIKRNGQDWMK